MSKVTERFEVWTAGGYHPGTCDVTDSINIRASMPHSSSFSHTGSLLTGKEKVAITIDDTNIDWYQHQPNVQIVAWIAHKISSQTLKADLYWIAVQI